jgi:hypothetical protein
MTRKRLSLAVALLLPWAATSLPLACSSKSSGGPPGPGEQNDASNTSFDAPPGSDAAPESGDAPSQPEGAALDVTVEATTP